VTSLHFVVPGDLGIRAGGYLYDRHIVEGLRRRGLPLMLHELGAGGYPLPDADAVARAAARLAAMPDGAAVVIDGLAFGALPEVAAGQAGRLRLIALVHHPLACETGLDAATARRLFDSEQRALAHAERCIVTSPFTARTLAADFGVPADRLHVVPPGVDPAPLAAGSDGSEPHLLCVATVTPRKGHAVLLDALAGLRDLPWRLTCAGSLEHHPLTTRAVLQQCRELGLAGRVVFAGELDESGLARLYDGADLFVLASHYEGYGMVLDEALARGLPIVATAAGAAADTVPPAAGLLVPPGDPTALAAALRRALTEPGLRARLAEGARAARQDLPTWPQTVDRFIAALGLGAAVGIGAGG
jgi:glycosyltransferase involved in cell wall biosynthesis